MMGSQAEMKKMVLVETDEESDFYQSVMEHRDTLISIAYSYLRNRHDALEAMQEMTCRAWIKHSTLKDEKAFKAWIIRILIFVCIDEQRHRKRAVPLPDHELEEAINEPSFGGGFNHNKLAIWSVLKDVKPKYRHVLLLKYYNDMTLTEIAAILRKPEGTVKTWQHKGLEQLRKLMNNRGEWQDD